MKNYQFIIFIILFSVLFIFFGSSALIILNYNTRNKLTENMVNISAVKDLQGISDLQKAGTGKKYYKGTKGLQKKKEIPAIQIIQPGIQDVTTRIGQSHPYSLASVQNPVSDIQNVTNRQGFEKDEPVQRIEPFENFVGTSSILDEAIFKNTLPNPNLDNKIQNNDHRNLVKLANKIPGDNILFDEMDKIYINPFYPSDFKKSTAKKGQKPNQHYPHPDEMNSVEKNAFKFGYPNYMTMQDYVNWIFMFKDSPNLLNLPHMRNYQKLINGIHVIYEHGVTPPPAKRLTPLNAEDYYNQMYTEMPSIRTKGLTQTINQEVKVASNQGDPDDGIMGYNTDEYGNFVQNFDVYGNTQPILNPLLGEKIDPFFLQNMVGPNWDKKGKYAPQITT